MHGIRLSCELCVSQNEKAGVGSTTAGLESINPTFDLDPTEAPREHVSRELFYFLLLNPAEQKAAIQRLHTSGMSDTTIAAATKLSVEQIRRLLEPQTTGRS